MYRLSLLVYLFLFMPVVAICQDKFMPLDFSDIKMLAEEPEGNYYYPKLMERYKNNDTTLNGKEMRVLYYGIFFHDRKYLQLFSIDKNRDSIKAIFDKVTLTDDDKRKLISYYLITHQEQPFNLKTLNVLYKLHAELKNPQAVYYKHKVQKIRNAIYSTGDGKTSKTGFYINSISDEYSILKLLGLKYAGTQSLIENCDYLKVAENNQDREGVYFNVGKILEEEAAMLQKMK